MSAQSAVRADKPAQAPQERPTAPVGSAPDGAATGEVTGSGLSLRHLHPSPARQGAATPDEPSPIAVFASGSGSNFEAIAAACADGRLAARIALLVCDKPGAAVCDRAARYGIETFVFDPHDFPAKAAYEREIVQRLDAAGVRLVCLAGYMRLVGDVLLGAYAGRILNIHPSLLPAFKGAHAIRDAFDYGVRVYGVTIHRVDATLDGGPIVAQRAFDYDGRDPDELERRIHAVEHALYVETIGKLLTSG